MFGNDEKKLSDTDFFPIAAGIVLGVLFGKLNISFSDSFSFSPGLTGGILIVALILSAIGKTGPIIWSMSGSANQLLRQIGLLLFLAEVGTSAGVNLVSTFQESGWTLFGIGMAITMVPMIVAVLFGYFVFKIHILDLIGTIRRNDQYARTCRRRFDERQFCPQHRVCDGLSDCDGVPNSFYPVHRRIGRIRIMRVATS